MSFGASHARRSSSVQSTTSGTSTTSSSGSLHEAHASGGNAAVYASSLAEQGPDGEKVDKVGEQGPDGEKVDKVGEPTLKDPPTGGTSTAGTGTTGGADAKAAPTTVAIAASATKVTLMDSVTFKATAGGTTPSTYKFEIRRNADTAWHTLQDGTSANYIGTARLAGEFKVRVTAGGATSSESGIGVEFPTYSTIVGNGTVSAACSAAWTETKNATTATGRREQAFWVQLNTSNGAYSTTGAVTGPVVDNATGAYVSPGATPADNPTAPTFSNASAVYTVACFHTHTPMTYRYPPDYDKKTDAPKWSRPVGPSGPDGTFHNGRGIVGIVYDYSAAAVSGHDINAAAQLYHNGPTRRNPVP